MHASKCTYKRKTFEIHVLQLNTTLNNIHSLTYIDILTFLLFPILYKNLITVFKIPVTFSIFMKTLNNKISFRT